MLSGKHKLNLGFAAGSINITMIVYRTDRLIRYCIMKLHISIILCQSRYVESGIIFNIIMSFIYKAAAARIDGSN